MQIIRTVAVSGATAVALLSGAGVATAATGHDAPAVSDQTVHRAASAHVSLPDGRSAHVRGMENAAYRADADHHEAVATLADDKPGAGDLSTGHTAQDQQGQGQMPQQQPGQQVPAGQQQMQQPGQQAPGTGAQTQAGSGAALSATAVGALVLGLLIFMWQKHGLKKGHAVGCTAFGVLITPTFVGPLITQLVGSAAGSFGNLWAGLGS